MSFKGFYIQSSILQIEDLSLKEVVLLCEIISLSKKTGECYASNHYLKQFIKVGTKTRVSQLVSGLVKKGFIKTAQEAFYGKRIITLTGITKKLIQAKQPEVKQPATQQQAFQNIGQLYNILETA